MTSSKSPPTAQSVVTAADRVHVSSAAAIDLIWANAGAAAGPDASNARNADRTTFQLSRSAAAARTSVIKGNDVRSVSFARADRMPPALEYGVADRSARPNR
jgi:hypothetical protein